MKRYILSTRMMTFASVYCVILLLMFLLFILFFIVAGFGKPEDYIVSLCFICFTLCICAAIIFSMIRFSKWRALQKKYGAILVIDEDAKSVTDHRLSEEAYFIGDLHGVRNGLAIGPPLLAFFVENQLLVLEWPETVQRKKIMLNFMYLKNGAEARKTLVDMATRAGKWKHWLQK